MDACTTDKSVKKTRIVILGGGFAGVEVARRLEKLARGAEVEVTLVNRDNFSLFTPMLHEVVAGDIEASNIVNPIRKLLRRVNFFAGDVRAIDLERKQVHVAHGDGRHPHVLPYDHLVLALGSTTNFFGLPGLEERAFTMKSVADAVRLRDHVVAQLEEADFECAAAERESLLTFLVAGGGFAGVETAGGLNDFVRESLRFYPHLRAKGIRVVLVSAGPALLPELSPKLGSYAQRKLNQRGVEILLETSVRAVKGRTIELSSGQSITANTLVWAAGIAPSPLLDSLSCPRERGRVVVDEHLEVPGWPGVWAVGDCAFIRDPRTGAPYPPTAQHAVREAKVLAHNLRAAVRGGWKKRFAFTTLGQLATIGRRTGVANVLGINFSGFIAWWLWRSIYLSKLPRLEKKVRVALDWTLDLLFSKDLVQLTAQRAATDVPDPGPPVEPLKRKPALSR